MDIPSINLEDEPIPTIPTLKHVPTEDGFLRPADLVEIVEEGGVKKVRLHFHPGQYKAWQSERRFVAVIAGSQGGKDLAINTPILTPNGFKTMGDIHVGMEVYGSDGKPCRVTAESEVFTDHECWELTLDCGEKIVAGKDHLWTVHEPGVGKVTISTAYLVIEVNALGKVLIPNVDADCPIRGLRSWGEWREIVGAKKVPTVRTKCIAVDSLDRLYLCGISCIPTHNTVLGPVWLLREIQLKGPGDYLVVAPTFTLLELKALPAFKRYFEVQMKLGKYIGSPIRRFEFSAEGDEQIFGAHDPMYRTTVYFAYAEDPESLESMTVKAAWLDEAGQRKFKLGSWQAIQRRLAVNRGRALLTTTPYDFGWLKKEIFDRFEAGEKDYDVINFKSTDNPAFSQEEYDRAKASLPEWQFELFYNGNFQKPAGLIYNCVGTRNFCKRFPIPATWDRILGLDFGGVNTAAIFIAEEPFTPYLYVYRTYKAGNRTAIEHCFYIQEGEPEFRLVAGGSKGEGQWRQEFRAGGTAMINGVVRTVTGLLIRKPKEADVKLGINRAYGAYKRGELIVFDDLEDIAAELNAYTWELDDKHEPTGEIEDKSTFHLMDAKRYIISSVRGPYYEQELPVTSETRAVRDASDRSTDLSERRRILEDQKRENERIQKQQQEENDALDRKAHNDPFDPRWWR